jgi:ABC-type cobalamin/Fe3+-siderophores transport system ATPase subunit
VTESLVQTGLTTRGLHVRLAGRPILRGVDLAITEGQVTAIIGPNGCGKSTLLRSLARIVRPESGTVMLDGQDLWRADPNACARQVAFLPQSPIAPEGLRVRALVERGRTPWLGPFRPLTAADRAAVDDAIALTGLADLQTRRLDWLSGGQRQRAWIALAIAQATPILLLDEPTTFLDLPHQIEVLRLVRKLNTERGRTVVMVLHDINQASRHADRIVAMRQGQVLFQGDAAQAITPASVRALFDIDVRVVGRDDGTPPLIVPE